MELEVSNQELLYEIYEREEAERQLLIQTTAMKAAANGILITDPGGEILWANPALTIMSGYTQEDLIGQNMSLFKSGKHSADFYRQMWRTILAGEVWHGEMINRRKDGSLYFEEQTITPLVKANGEISHFVAIKQDITARKQAEAELEQRNLELEAMSATERKQRQLAEALVAAALVLNKSLDLDEVLKIILEQIRQVIPYQFADIGLLEGYVAYDASLQGGTDLPAAQAGMMRRYLLADFPLLKNMCESGKPVLITDTEKEPDWKVIESFEWCRSFLSVPFIVEKRVIGSIILFDGRASFYTEEMRDRLVVFASHAAAAIQNAWLFEQVRASKERLQSLSRRLVEIQEAERLYISRELHDEAGQMLTSLMLDLRLLEKKASQPDAILRKVSEMEGSLNDVIENLHNVAMALRPASLDHLGLVSALRQHVGSFGEKYGLKAHFRSKGVLKRLEPDVETVLYRVVQEALTNVARHAQATQVDVVLTVRDDKLLVIIEDNGNGFNPEEIQYESHLGLFGMRERVEMIAGNLVIESTPGNGTTIMVEVDYDDSDIDRG